jgi:hypothetical protein
VVAASRLELAKNRILHVTPIICSCDQFTLSLPAQLRHNPFGFPVSVGHQLCGRSASGNTVALSG